LYNITEGLKIVVDLSYKTKIYLINDYYMNALSIVKEIHWLLITITKGLLYKLNWSELSSVINYEINHIKSLNILIVFWF
jgi:Zn-dependent protease with chaperone function